MTGDLILVSQPAGAISITTQEVSGAPTAFDIVACDVGTASFDPPAATYTWAVIGN